MRKLMLMSLAVLLIPVALVMAVLASPERSGSAQTPLQDEASWTCAWTIEPATVLAPDGRPYSVVNFSGPCSLTLLGAPATDIAVIDAFMSRFLFDLDTAPPAP